jgi:hypothetical protein
VPRPCKSVLLLLNMHQSHKQQLTHKQVNYQHTCPCCFMQGPFVLHQKQQQCMLLRNPGVTLASQLCSSLHCTWYCPIHMIDCVLLSCMMQLSAAAAYFGLDDYQKDVILGGYIMAAFFAVGAPAALLVRPGQDSSGPGPLSTGPQLPGDLPAVLAAS